MRARQSPCTSTLRPALRELAHAHDHPDRAGPIELRGRRIVGAGIALGDQEAEAVVRFQRLGHRLHRDGPRHAQRHDHVGEDDQVANRQAAAGRRGSRGSPSDSRHSSVTRHTVSRGPEKGPSPAGNPRDRYVSLFVRRVRSNVVRHRPDSAEAVGGDVAHLARQRPPGRRPDRRRRPPPRRQHAQPLAGRDPDPRPCRRWRDRARPARSSRAAASSGRRSGRAPRRSPPRSRRRCRARSRAPSSLASPSFSLQVRSWPSCQRLTPASDA